MSYGQRRTGQPLPPSVPPQRRKPSPARHGAVAALLAVAALVLAACSSGSKPGPPTTAATQPSHAAVSTVPVAAASASATANPLDAVYASVCQLLGAGAPSQDIASLAGQQLSKDGISGYTGQGIVAAAEKQDCPQYLPAPVATATATAPPAMTATEQQAVDAAQNYLALGTGFSEEGLLKQLTSSYGSGFSQADAQFAVSYLHPDWDAQAVEAAQNYLKLGTGFSRASLIQQLTSSYGSGFTEAQAEYAAGKVGL